MIFNAAFESGGIKGLAYIGALRFLESRGVKIYTTSGTSVGALFAALISSGYTSTEIYQEIESIDIDTLLKKNTFFTALKNIGANSIENLENKLEELLKRKNIKTFGDLKVANDYLLKVAVTDYSKKKKLILPCDYKLLGYNPDDQLVSKAVCMSCSVPLLYSVYKYKNSLFADGGLVDKLPVSALTNEYPILVFKISNDKRCIESLKGFTDDELRKKGIYVIKIDTLGINSLNFKKGLEMRKTLYKNGYNAMKNYYEKHLNLY